MSSRPSVLSIVRSTWARPNAARPDVPAKITSAMFEPRSARAPCSPMTQARASTTLDLPDPLGPTTHVMPGWRASVVALAKDLNPRSVRVLRCILAGYRPLSKSRGTTGRFRASRCPRSPSRGSGSPCGGCSTRDPGHRGSCRRERSSGRSDPMRTRMPSTTRWPSTIMATTGPEFMNSRRPSKKGLSLWSA